MSDLEHSAIELLKVASEMSLKLYKQPLVITYSGGKDSDVLMHLAGKAGIPYEALHSLTTADAPETVWHVRDTFHRLELAGVPCDIDRHKQPDGTYMTMWRLIPLKLMPPTRIVRYCCAALKETSGRGRWIATGVRWAESQKRKSRGVMEALHRDKAKRLTLMNDNDESRMMMETCQLKGTRVVNPLIDWSTESIWDYCAVEKICMNPLYACGEDRVGCINCAMAGARRKLQLARYPGYRDAYIRAYQRMIEERCRRGLPTTWETGEEVLHWLLEDGVLPGQMVLDGMEEDTL